MAEEKRYIVDLKAMGERLGLETVDVIRDGKVIMRDHAWNKPALQKAVSEISEGAAGTDIVELQGHVPNWVLDAMALAVRPAKCFFKIGPNGMYELTSLPFPITTEPPVCGMFFEVREDGETVYVKAMTDDPNADAHGFDLTKFGEITMPPIPAGKNVFLSGETVNPVAVSMALTYAPEARTVYSRFHQEPNYYCVMSTVPDVEIGDSIAAE